MPISAPSQRAGKRQSSSARAVLIGVSASAAPQPEDSLPALVTWAIRAQATASTAIPKPRNTGQSIVFGAATTGRCGASPAPIGSGSRASAVSGNWGGIKGGVLSGRRCGPTRGRGRLVRVPGTPAGSRRAGETVGTILTSPLSGTVFQALPTIPVRHIADLRPDEPRRDVPPVPRSCQRLHRRFRPGGGQTGPP